MLLPLLIACVIAHGFTVIFMRRSILTEKISRRGYHLSREYAVDPLEIIFVREAMRTNIVALTDTLSHQDLERVLYDHHTLNGRSQHFYGEHVSSQEGISDIQQRDGTQRSDAGGMVRVDTTKTLLQHVYTQPVVAYPDEPLRAVMDRMAETGYTRLPVVERNDSRKLAGLISLHDLLKARARSLEEHRRERVRVRLRFPTRRKEEIKQL
jgi:CBS domain-containing protein